MKEITTIKISKETVMALTQLKIHPRQSYEEVIVNLLEAKKIRRESINEKHQANDITTIKISRRTVEKLSLLKIHPRQSYEEVILGLLCVKDNK